MNKANMAGQLSHLDNDGIEWAEAVSKNGVPFLVGVKGTEVKGGSPLSHAHVTAIYAEKHFSRRP
jgi:hypothetical protein